MTTVSFHIYDDPRTVLYAAEDLAGIEGLRDVVLVNAHYVVDVTQRGSMMLGLDLVKKLLEDASDRRTIIIYTFLELNNEALTRDHRYASLLSNQRVIFIKQPISFAKFRPAIEEAMRRVEAR